MRRRIAEVEAGDGHLAGLLPSGQSLPVAYGEKWFPAAISELCPCYVPSEDILVSPGHFETCPRWVPAMDWGQWFALIALKTIPVHRFDHKANRVAKVRNVSRLGNQSIVR